MNGHDPDEFEKATPTASPPLDPRVPLAADRTLLAWIRTGIAMMGFGFVVARFGLFLREIATAGGHPLRGHSHVSSVVGTSLIVLGAIVTALASIQHRRFLNAHYRGELLDRRGLSLGTFLAAVIVVAGVGLAAYLLFV